MPNILIIDDNEEILAANKDYLTKQGFTITCAETGIKALASLNEHKYDCIILDVLLPDLDGFTLCKAARTITDTPILFLSCLEEADDKVKGLVAGGDDYMTKPYSLKELAVRIHALMRRGKRREEQHSDFYIYHENRIIHALGKNVLLSEKEFNLFLLFFEHPNIIFSKKEILDKIWYGHAEIGVVAVLVLKLRRKIEFAESVIGQITNTYGSGYCLSPPDTEESL